MPDLSEEEKAAHRVHKVSYDVALEAPPFRVIGTVYCTRAPSRTGCSTGRPRCSSRSSTPRRSSATRRSARRRRYGPAQPLLPARRRADRQADRVEAPEAARSAARRHLVAGPARWTGTSPTARGNPGGRLRRRRDARRRDPDLVRLGRLARHPAADVHGGAGGAHRARRRPSRAAAACSCRGSTSRPSSRKRADAGVPDDLRVEDLYPDAVPACGR